MSPHEFTLILPGAEGVDPRTMDALFEAGCSDATPSVREGRVRLAFTREAETRSEAIESAVRDVRRAGFDAAEELNGGPRP